MREFGRSYRGCLHRLMRAEEAGLIDHDRHGPCPFLDRCDDLRDLRGTMPPRTARVRDELRGVLSFDLVRGPEGRGVQTSFSDRVDRALVDFFRLGN